MSIAKFYDNQEIFITGGTGFIGKALIEKLLRSCPRVGNIYVLIRGKKGKSGQDRLCDVLKAKLFNRLRQEQPQTFRKVVAIEGDCSQLGLGISAEDLEKLQNVSIIYHSAASVRFDDALRDAILLNTRGTYELVKLAETLQHLRVFVHVSTTYCNPDHLVVEEAVYPPYADWRTSIKLAETYSTETLNVLNLKYGGFQPNTYTFTKSLAEQVINDHRNKLPVIIFRPSIVISSLSEPVPGWIDNFNGPIGMLVACGVGILRTNYTDPDIVSDFVPVDVVVKAMVVAAYKKSVMGHDPKADIEVYNCATSCSICPVSTAEIVEIGRQVIRENPLEKTLWVPGGLITRCPAYNFIRVIVLHVLVAILADTALRFMNHKPFLLRLQRRISAALQALHYFGTRQWTFKNENFLALDSLIIEREIEKFSFAQLQTTFDTFDYYRNGIRGAKEFLLNEPPDSSRGAKFRLRVYDALDFLIRLIIRLLLARFIVRYIYFNYL